MDFEAFIRLSFADRYALVSEAMRLLDAYNEGVESAAEEGQTERQVDID